MPHVTGLSLVSGGLYQQRESAIADIINLRQISSDSQSVAVILEGLPSGTLPLTELLPDSTIPIDIHRIAPGCMHCIGNLVLRVTLNRVLRQRPDHLFLGIADDQHLAQLHHFLSQIPYDQLLRLDQNIVL